MDFQPVFFYLFSVVLIFAAFRVMTARNPVHAVLYLMLTFSQAAGLWLLLKAEFLAIMLVLVYLGAVMVLFIFVVMMLDIRIDGVRQGFWKHFPLAAGIAAVVVLQMAAVLMAGFSPAEVQPMAAEAAHPSSVYVQQTSNTRALGMLFYTEYLYPLQVAAVILLVGMIAAIALTLRQRKDSKKIDASKQVRVKARDRVEVVQMAPTRAAPADEPAREAPAPQEKQA